MSDIGNAGPYPGGYLHGHPKDGAAIPRQVCQSCGKPYNLIRSDFGPVQAYGAFWRIPDCSHCGAKQKGMALEKPSPTRGAPTPDEHEHSKPNRRGCCDLCGARLVGFNSWTDGYNQAMADYAAGRTVGWPVPGHSPGQTEKSSEDSK